jgi:hypothetical protein
MLKFVACFGFVLFFGAGGLAAGKVSKGSSVNTSATLYKSLIGKNRAEIVQIARAEIERRLPGVDLKFYRNISVGKTSKYYRVTFESNVSLPSQDTNSPGRDEPVAVSRHRKQSFISLYSSELKDEVTPAEKSQLFNFSDEILELMKMFGEKDRLSIEERPDSWLVGVSHPSSDSSSGGWERYSIDKKTKVQKMVDHEQPSRSNRDGIEIRGPKETDPEIEVND